MGRWMDSLPSYVDDGVEVGCVGGHGGVVRLSG